MFTCRLAANVSVAGSVGASATPVDKSHPVSATTARARRKRLMSVAKALKEAGEAR